MKRLLLLIVSLVLLAIAAFAYLESSAQSKTLADVSSPSGDWRVIVRGKDVIGGVEVTADVHTRDGRVISRGVIDLRPEWAETEHDYQAHKTLHTRIDEVKAVVGDTVLFRDDYFPGEDFAVTGTIEGQEVKFRIGEVNNLGFHFMSGLSLTDGEKVSVQFIDFPSKLASGKVFDIDVSVKPSFNPDITYYLNSPESGRLQVVSHDKPFSLHLEVDQATKFVVTGTLQLRGDDPDVDLSGTFRLVNILGDSVPDPKAGSETDD